MIKKIGIFLFFVAVLFLLSILQYTVKYMEEYAAYPYNLPTNTTSRPVTLALVGDIMLDRGVRQSVQKNYANDFSALFENIPELHSTDITFGNLEGPITESMDRRGSIYSFKMDPIVGGVLKSVGFDVVSFANNHVGDYGVEGFNDTLTTLSENDILYTGAGRTYEEARRAVVMRVKGKTIGFLGFSDVGPEWMKAKETSPGILLASDPDLESIITQEKQQVDYLVVSFHFGAEYVPTTDRQRELATRAVISGADIVVGHHPHVVQDDISINGKPVLFSLGNFIFDQHTPQQVKTGMVVIVTIQGDGSISTERYATDRDGTYKLSALRPFEQKDLIYSTKTDTPFECPRAQGKLSNGTFLSFPRVKPLKSFVPENLVVVSREYTGGMNVCATKKAYDAFLLLEKDMKKEDLTLMVKYGFRDNDSQEALVHALAKDGREEFVAPVGQSEHVLGTAFDFASGTSTSSFVNSKEYAYLNAHAHAYGFVQSFKGDTMDETNIPVEPWHWRYIGPGMATALKESGLPVNLFLKSY